MFFRIFRVLLRNVERQFCYRRTFKWNYMKMNHVYRVPICFWAEQSYKFRPGLWNTLALGTVINCANNIRKYDKGLMKAVQDGNLKEVDRYIQNKADVNMRHSLGWTLLMLAAVNGQYSVVEKLLEAGADPNMTEEFVGIHRASREFGIHPFEVQAIREGEFSRHLNHGNNFRGFTALHYAVLLNQTAIVRKLIEKGANPLLQNDLGHTPVMYAADDTMKKYLEREMTEFTDKEKQRSLDERLKFPLEERLKKHLVGQQAAIATVAATIRRKENGWADDEHPLVFLFLGSSGIGKTELAKQMAAYMHKNKPDSFIRLDMSEYQEKHEVAKLIGAPPGYIGHDEGGQLTKRLKKCPNAVVLFDEVDKAHPDVLTVLLQLFDEGRLTDGQGKTIQCRDATFVMTSNLASDEIAQHALKLRREVVELQEKRLSNLPSDQHAVDTDEVIISRSFKDLVVKPILKQHFKRDEFLGRINEIVYFLPFSRPELLLLVARELTIWAERALQKHSIRVEWDRSVEAALADGYDVSYGARSIKYEVERRVINELAAAHELGLIGKGCSVKVWTEWQTTTDTPTIRLSVKWQNSNKYEQLDLQTTKRSVTQTGGLWNFFY